MAWKLENSHGKLECRALTGAVDISRPDRGIHQLQLNSAPIVGRTCAVEREKSSTAASATWPATLSDGYVRGDDLVATYQATDAWPFAPQIYWHADAGNSIGQ